MKGLAGSILIMIVAMMVSCFQPPEFPAKPSIEVSDLYFGDIPAVGATDSIVVSLAFQDGDGDLGLSPVTSGEDQNCVSEGICYNERFYFEEGTNRRFISRAQAGIKYINYKTKRTILGYDTLPNFEPPFSCINWDVIQSGDTIVDTIYFQKNPNHNNIFVDFLIKQADGSFELYDWDKEFQYPGCNIGYDGRFPILFNDNSGSPLEGTLSYSLKSSAFAQTFSARTLKLQIQIQDRALNKSNVVETREFTLQQIRR